MTNKEILQANLLDIIFENRNKEYGAYALRNDYEKRLLKALGIGLGLVLFLILLNFIRISNADPTGNENDKPSISISNVDLTPKKSIEPEKPIEKPKELEKVKTIKNTTIEIVPNDKAKDPPPSINDILGAITSTVTTNGNLNKNQIITNPTLVVNGNGGELKTIEPEKEFKIREQAPEYPGGTAALIEFMRRNLVTPDQLEIGDKKIVKVKFVVGKDGSITDIVILESPGKEYEKEVSRVVKKMPRWKPGIQNDITVAVSYVLPITFIAVED
jgi:protein TonB